MEQIRATLTPFMIRSGSMRISHRHTDLGRGLEFDEQILVRDPRTDVYVTATVVAVDFELEDTTYLLSLGREISAADAADRRAPVEPTVPGQLSTQDVMALLDILKRGRFDAVPEAMVE